VLEDLAELEELGEAPGGRGYQRHNGVTAVGRRLRYNEPVLAGERAERAT
jgi:hypothetical protein